MTKQTFPTGAQIAGDLGGTSASPQVTGAHFGGSDGQYLIRRSGIWAPATPAYTDLSGIPASFTPSAHESTHDPGGSDAIKDLTRLAAGPALYGYVAWTADPVVFSNNLTPAAGAITLFKILTAHGYTINNVDVMVNTAGTGVTPLANCFIGIYDSGGTRRFLSSDQSTSWATNGLKTAAVSGGYTVAATDYIYLALLVGTQSTTNVNFVGSTAFNTWVTQGNLSASAYRVAQNGTGQTALPSSLTLSSNISAPNNRLVWFGVR